MKRGRPLGAEPKGNFHVDLRDADLSAEFHNYCRENSLDKKQLAETAIREYMSRIVGRHQIIITLSDDAFGVLEDFCLAAWGASVNVVVAEAVKAYVPEQLPRNQTVRERYESLRNERQKKPLVFRQPTS